MKNAVFPMLVVVVLTLTSFTDPLDKVYNENTLTADLREILAQDSPDSTAYKAISQYLLIMAFSEEQLVGKTYRELLEGFYVWEVKQKVKEAEEDALAEQAALEQERRYDRLRKVVEVELTGREVVYKDSLMSVTYYFTVRNKSTKKIKSVEGMLEVNQGLSTSFLGIDLDFPIPMAGHSARPEKITATFFRTKEKDQEPENTPVEQAKVVWRPEKFLLVDGTVLD